MARPTILVTGVTGQLGRELAVVLMPHGDVFAADRARLDLADPDAIVAAVRGAKPALIVNAAAYTSVDQAESERPLAHAINGRAPGVLAEEAKRAGAVLIHYSTDYVFDGNRTTPYPEDAPTGPLNVYGASKLEGERAIAAIGGSALVFRRELGLRVAREELSPHDPPPCRRERRAPDRRRSDRSPQLVSRARRSDGASRGDGAAGARRARRSVSPLVDGVRELVRFRARAIVGDAQTPRIVPITTAEYPLPAKRPAYGVLATERFTRSFGFALPDWRDALARCLARSPDPAELR